MITKHQCHWNRPHLTQGPFFTLGHSAALLLAPGEGCIYMIDFFCVFWLFRVKISLSLFYTDFCIRHLWYCTIYIYINICIYFTNLLLRNRHSYMKRQYLFYYNYTHNTIYYTQNKELYFFYSWWSWCTLIMLYFWRIECCRQKWSCGWCRCSSHSLPHLL